MGESRAKEGQPGGRRAADAAGTGRARVPEVVRDRAGPGSDAAVAPEVERVSSVSISTAPSTCFSRAAAFRASVFSPGSRRALYAALLVPATISAVAPVPAVRSSHSSGSCRWCELLPPYIRAVRSVCWMPVEPASSIVHALKYQGWPAVAVEIAGRMSRLSWPPDVVDERAALVPIPLASARKRQRGYNQSALIARGLGRRWRIPVWEDARRAVTRDCVADEVDTRGKAGQRCGLVPHRRAAGRTNARRCTSFWLTTW